MTDRAATASTARAAGNSTFTTALRVSLFMYAMLLISSTVYKFFWNAFSLDAVLAMLGEWRVEQYQIAVLTLQNLSLVPLTYAILVVLAPLVGWWIYSRIEPAQQTRLGWIVALLFAGYDILVSLVKLGLVGIFWHPALIWMAIGQIIVVLFTMFFMGIGFNLAKLFRVQL